MKKLLKMSKKFASALTIFALLAMMLPAPSAMAANISSAKATFGRLKASTNADSVVVEFVTPTGIQTGGADTITLTFSADFTLASEAATNFDIGLGDSGTCSTANYTDETVSLTASATDWGVDVTGNVITFSPETDDTLTAGYCIRFEMGTAATTGGTGAADTIQNGDADNDDTITIGGVFGDSGTLSVDIIADDQVVITATVDPSITFTISDNAVGFGTLTSANARWATSDANGTAVQPAASSGAHELTVGTNASGGYSITYNGATLTSGSDTIDVATISGDGDGTPGTEQFAMALDDNGGNVTIPSAYDYASNNYSFVAGTTTQIASETGPTATETLDVQYVSNIAALTEAGNYSTTITFIATGTY